MTDSPDQAEIEEVWEQFHSVVNMTSRELLDWLGVEPDVRVTPGPPEPAPLGMAVVSILAKRRTDLTSSDLDAMRRVIEIVTEETAGEPPEKVAADERRRHRLLNVGHDVLKEK